MSHISRLKTQMVEKDLVLLALNDLGYQFEEGNLEIEGLKHENIPIEIKVISRFGNDIGLRKKQGVYEIVADWWGVLGITQKKFCDQLNQRYAYLAVRSRLEQQGFSLASEETQGGKIHLVLRRMA